MKQAIYIILILLAFSNPLKSQEKSPYPIFIKSVERNFTPTYAHKEDTCFFTATYLILEIDEHYKVKSVVLADNAPDLQKQELEKARSKFIVEEIEKYLEVNKIKTPAVLFPFIARKDGITCTSASKNGNLNRKLFLHDGKISRGLVMDMIEIIYY